MKPNPSPYNQKYFWDDFDTQAQLLKIQLVEFPPVVLQQALQGLANRIRRAYGMNNKYDSKGVKK